MYRPLLSIGGRQRLNRFTPRTVAARNPDPRSSRKAPRPETSSHRHARLPNSPGRRERPPSRQSHLGSHGGRGRRQGQASRVRRPSHFGAFDHRVRRGQVRNEEGHRDGSQTRGCGRPVVSELGHQGTVSASPRGPRRTPDMTRGLVSYLLRPSRARHRSRRWVLRASLSLCCSSRTICHQALSVRRSAHMATYSAARPTETSS